MTQSEAVNAFAWVEARSVGCVNKPVLLRLLLWSF
jgi:hypothetical protein